MYKTNATLGIYPEVKENYQDIETLEDLQNNTSVIEIPNTDRLIIQAY